MPETENNANVLLIAVGALVGELRKEVASGLISRPALVAPDQVERLMQSQTTLATSSKS